MGVQGISYAKRGGKGYTMRATLLIASTVLVLLVGALLPTSASADTVTVCWDGSGDHLTIQEGIDAA